VGASLASASLESASYASASFASASFFSVSFVSASFASASFVSTSCVIIIKIFNTCANSSFASLTKFVFRATASLASLVQVGRVVELSLLSENIKT
jgi:hypothetical protein